MVMLFLLVGCVPAEITTSQVVTVTPVTVSPASAELEVGDSQQFVSAEAGTWSVMETNGGTISSTGLYTAPASDGTYHVLRTTSNSLVGSAAVKVRRTVISVSPSSAQVLVGGNIQFVATVTGPTDTSVSWSVTETGGGTISATGLYSAPANAGNFHVIATTVVKNRKSATAAVAVNSPIVVNPVVSIAVSPATAAINSCLTYQFGTIISGTSNTGVTWSIQEGAAGGTISATGLYTAPAIAGIYHIVAVSKADVTKSSVAAVTVTDKVVSVSVSPNTVSLRPGEVQLLTATVITSCGAQPATSQLMSMSADGRLVPINQ